ncbi:MAG: hypothetical protein V7605_397 [Acidimicrobiaceae bacterium]
MSDVSAAEVRSFLLHHIHDQVLASGLSPQELSDDFDLLATGTIDSMGLIELLSALEDRFGVTADLGELDTEDIGLIGPFCEHIAHRARS